MSESLRYLSFVESVCKRPRMYTMHGTFGEVVAFIEGYYSRQTELGEFLAWLPKKITSFNGVSWGTCLQELYPEDEEAINQLGALWAEYQAEQKNEG